MNQEVVFLRKAKLEKIQCLITVFSVSLGLGYHKDSHGKKNTEHLRFVDLSIVYCKSNGSSSFCLV